MHKDRGQNGISLESTLEQVVWHDKLNVFLTSSQKIEEKHLTNDNFFYLIFLEQIMKGPVSWK